MEGWGKTSSVPRVFDLPIRRVEPVETFHPSSLPRKVLLEVLFISEDHQFKPGLNIGSTGIQFVNRFREEGSLAVRGGPHLRRPLIISCDFGFGSGTPRLEPIDNIRIRRQVFKRIFT